MKSEKKKSIYVSISVQITVRRPTVHTNRIAGAIMIHRTPYNFDASGGRTHTYRFPAKTLNL